MINNGIFGKQSPITSELNFENMEEIETKEV